MKCTIESEYEMSPKRVGMTKISSKKVLYTFILCNFIPDYLTAWLIMRYHAKGRLVLVFPNCFVEAYLLCN